MRAGWEVDARVRGVATITLAGLLLAGGAGAGTYVVRPGDTVGTIAARHRFSPGALARANGLRDPDRIRIGQRLTIPDLGGPPAPATTYTVRRGDTLASVSARTGVPAATIAQANGLVDGRLYSGARLRLAPLRARDGRALAGPSVAGGGGVRVVRKGDSLGAIAAAAGTTAAALAKANGIANPNRVAAGTHLIVPGGWRCPVAGPTTFVNDWGFPREGGRSHEGTDLLARRGTPIVAPVSGMVRQVIGARAGRQFTLVGDDGFTYIGVHMDTFGAAGRVAAGTVLGTVGDSGDARGGPPHLHFEIHPAGIGPVNPYPTVRAACRG